nr:PREDICTED: POU domain, class 6, transcription factor 1 [Struthio camelus australis]
MDTEAVQPQEASLTVNEQVIVMSSHETIRVLEVGVDAPLPAEEERKALEMPAREVVRGLPGETTDPAREDVPPSAETSGSGDAVLTQENLATVVTGVMVPAGTVTQPLLIPISIAGQVAGQQGLAVWTFPTATVAALPGLTAASPTGGIFKPPIANLQAAAVLNAPPATLPAPNLQVQAVTPQLLLNAQGQVIATLASGTIQAAAIKKTSAPESPAKNEVSAKSSGAGGSIVEARQHPSPRTRRLAERRAVATVQPFHVFPAVPRLAEPQAPNASVDEDGINLEEIREFAKNFKIRRLSLGLTQTQVGQALTATEGPAYSQSAICRFEKLDITPKSAQKLKPVLEKWLSEAELRNQEGQQNLMEFVGGEPSKKRKRRTSFTPQAIEALNAYFEKNALPTGQEITEIAKELNYDREVVRVWFCNRRQTLKKTSKLNVFQIP